MKRAASPASPPDPQPDLPGQTMPGRTMPARIAALLHTVRILLGFGRYLAETMKDRSASTDFNAIAACFGTSRLYAILAHLQRGLLRAAALERVLLTRAAQGRDIQFVAPRERVTAAPVAPAGSPAPDRPAEGSPILRPATFLRDRFSLLAYLIGVTAFVPAGQGVAGN